ncbi:hypothetical protein HOE67_00790 [Candidatus Peregrinibacteria bacterium]|jgi:hypothetical protein|nr:hypothetical protein [Candidatus Peregrinibacteria bacterium]MBT4055625.1 hypothetical protein [Candidatus Peregrinibacteria bacterium]
MSDSDQKQQDMIAELSQEEQNHLNEPLVDPQGVDEKNKTFLDDVIKKIEDGDINLMSPSSIINQSVYEGLSEKAQGETDLSAVSLLARLRDIKGLHDIGSPDSYQMQNLVEQVRLTKERLEKDTGNIFII